MDKHVMQFAALGIAVVLVFLYYFVPWFSEMLSQHHHKQRKEAPKAPWYIRGIALLGILPTLYFIVVGVASLIGSGSPLGGLAALVIASLGVYTIWGLWWMRRVAGYLTLIFAILLLLAAMYLVFDASFHRELGLVLACSATIVGMAAIIYCLVTHLSRMK